jgi:hypothetical protein
MNVQELLAEMERDGIIERTGEMRPNNKGELEPAYVLTPEYAKRYGGEDGQALINAFIDRYGTRH